MTISERDYRLAREEGARAARLAHKKISDCPAFDRTLRGCAQVDAWQQGFTDERKALDAIAGATA